MSYVIEHYGLCTAWHDGSGEPSACSEHALGLQMICRLDYAALVADGDLELARQSEVASLRIGGRESNLDGSELLIRPLPWRGLLTSPAQLAALIDSDRSEARDAALQGRAWQAPLRSALGEPLRLPAAEVGSQLRVRLRGPGRVRLLLTGKAVR